MEHDSKGRRDGHEEVAREHEGRKGNRKGSGGHGRETRKGGKSDRSKGVVKGEHAEWTKPCFSGGLSCVGQVGAPLMVSGVTEYDSMVVSHKHDRERASYVGRDKTKDKKDDWKDRVDLKKEAWRDRRDKLHDNGQDAKGMDYGEISSNASRLSGDALLNMLKVSSPGVIRYTREELISISKLPRSKVKPASLHASIDGGNANSPLLVKTKPEKDDLEEKSVGLAGGYRIAGGFGDRVCGGAALSRNSGESGFGDIGGCSSCSGGFGTGFGEDGDWKVHPKVADASQAQSANDAQWDMPDVNAKQMCLNEFTLGDIREAERSLNLGMSMSDYKASLRAAGGPNGGGGGRGRNDDGGLVVAKNCIAPSTPSQTMGSNGKDDFFSTDNGHVPSVFVDEDEDVSCPSRGFGARLARRTGGVKQDHVPLGGMFRDSDLGNEPFLPFAKHDSSSGTRPRDVFGADRVTASNQQQQGVAAVGETRPTAELVASDSGASNQAGRSILTMLGRKTDAVPACSESSTVGSAVDLSQQRDSAGRGAFVGVHGASSSNGEAKLSVEALFNLAEGKDMPPIPASPRVAHEEGTDTDKTQRDMVQMASQLMWAAAKAKQPPTPLPGMFPGYQLPTSPYGTLPPSFGLAGGGPPTMVGREQASAFQEAYAQAILSLGKRGMPPVASAVSLPAGCDSGKACQKDVAAMRAARTPATASATVPWATRAAPNYSLAPSATSYSPPLYGQFPSVREYAHMPRGGAYDVGLEKGVSSQAAPVGSGKSSGSQPLGSAPAGGRVPGKAGVSPKSQRSGTTILSQPTAVPALNAGADSMEDDGDEDDASCSQS